MHLGTLLVLFMVVGSQVCSGGFRTAHPERRPNGLTPKQRANIDRGYDNSGFVYHIRDQLLMRLKKYLGQEDLTPEQKQAFETCMEEMVHLPFITL
jgi:hypothetical protein